MHGVDLDRVAVAVARRSLWLELGSAVRSHEEADAVFAVLRANVRWGNILLDEEKAGISTFDFVVGNPP